MKAVHTPFSIVKENSYVPGCTVSQQLLMGPSAAFLAFCLAPQTDISPETYAYPKLLTVLDGAMMVQAGGAAFPFPREKPHCSSWCCFWHPHRKRCDLY